MKKLGYISEVKSSSEDDIDWIEVHKYATPENIYEGEAGKIGAFIELMKPLGILEMCRTGIVALERGAETLLNK